MPELAQGQEGSIPLVASEPFVHIDTTLQIERQKASKRAEITKSALSQFKFRSSSTYARQEFNRTWIRDLAYLYVRAQRFDGIGDLLGEINRSFGSRQASKNRLTRCIEVMQGFLSARVSTLTVAEEMTRFRGHLAYMLTNAHRAWQRSVHHEFNGSQCWRADVRPVINEKGKLIWTLSDCRRGKIKCNVHGFFNANKVEFQKIAKQAEDMGDAASPQLRKAVRRIRIAEGDSQDLCDDWHCAQIGDCLIAVDGKQLPTFAANNDEDWVPIALFLGKQLINPLRAASAKLDRKTE